jgi:hypothetical protein
VITLQTIAGGQVIVESNGATVTEAPNLVVFTEPNGNVVTQTAGTETETGVPQITANAAVHQAFSFGALEAFVAALFWVLWLLKANDCIVHESPFLCAGVLPWFCAWLLTFEVFGNGAGSGCGFLWDTLQGWWE